MKKLNYNHDLAEFLGWYVGDGCLSVNSRYSEFTLTGDIVEEYPFYENVIIPTFNNIFKKTLKKSAILKKYKSVGVCGIYVFDKSFVSFLQKEFKLKSGKKLDISIPSIIKTEEQKKSFLRGLFDTDGSIFFCKSNFKTKKYSFYNHFHYKPKIKLGTISKNLIKQVYDMLTELDFSPRYYKPRKQRENENVMYDVVLDINKDTERWIKEIGFKNMKHLSKIHVWEKFGFVPPKTTLSERIKMLNGDIDPLSFYKDYKNVSSNKNINL